MHEINSQPGTHPPTLADVKAATSCCSVTRTTAAPGRPGSGPLQLLQTPGQNPPGCSSLRRSRYFVPRLDATKRSFVSSGTRFHSSAPIWAPQTLFSTRVAARVSLTFRNAVAEQQHARQHAGSSIGVREESAPLSDRSCQSAVPGIRTVLGVSRLHGRKPPLSAVADLGPDVQPDKFAPSPQQTTENRSWLARGDGQAVHSGHRQ